jgi:hypothetical protein
MLSLTFLGLQAKSMMRQACLEGKNQHSDSGKPD